MGRTSYQNLCGKPVGTMKQTLVKKTPTDRHLNRREMLRLTGVSVATAVMGSGLRLSGSEEPTRVSAQRPTGTATAAASSCVVRPQQTEGPYFVDEQLNRSDIRSEPSDGSVKEGIPVRLVLHVSRVAGSVCTPLSSAVVDVWQCDALGMYSDVQDINKLFDTRGKKFLRGSQMTDTSGTAQFITIYPGWYPGRTVHIHFKIRTDPAAQRGFEFTSQLYFDDAITDQVHAQAPYATKGQRPLKNDRDYIFRSGGDQLMLLLTKDAQGYAGTFDIGLQIT
jgi:protocatechuate 3,4-dioxygenase beta subunit